MVNELQELQYRHGGKGWKGHHRESSDGGGSTTSQEREGFDGSNEGLGALRSSVVTSRLWKGMMGEGRGVLEGAHDKEEDMPHMSRKPRIGRKATSYCAGG